jgi:hypothetical protein
MLIQSIAMTGRKDCGKIKETGDLLLLDPEAGGIG